MLQDFYAWRCWIFIQIQFLFCRYLCNEFVAYGCLPLNTLSFLLMFWCVLNCLLGWFLVVSEALVVLLQWSVSCYWYFLCWLLHRYARLRRCLLIDPHLSKDDGNKASDPVIDNPLSQNPGKLNHFFSSGTDGRFQFCKITYSSFAFYLVPER